MVEPFKLTYSERTVSKAEQFESYRQCRKIARPRSSTLFEPGQSRKARSRADGKTIAIKNISRCLDRGPRVLSSQEKQGWEATSPRGGGVGRWGGVKHGHVDRQTRY